MEWWETLLVLIAVGIAVAALSARLQGHQREMGRDRASRTNARRKEKRAAKEARRDAERLAAEKRSAKQAAADEIERLRRERVGVRFLRRSHKDDPGLHLTVVELDPTRSLHRVIVEEDASPDQVAGGSDHPVRTSVEWRVLTEPAADQRHRTARRFEDSFDDDDGWIQFERIP